MGKGADAGWDMRVSQLRLSRDDVYSSANVNKVCSLLCAKKLRYFRVLSDRATFINLRGAPKSP